MIFSQNFAYTSRSTASVTDNVLRLYILNIQLPRNINIYYTSRNTEIYA